jgi:hypothetical protein
MFAQEITAPAPAQEYYKHEIGVSYGAFAQPMLIPFPFNFKYPTILGSLNFDYYYHFNKKHSIGVALSLTSDYFNTHKYLSHAFGDEEKYPYLKERWSIYSALQLGYKMNYATVRNISFYFSIFAGLNISYNFYPSSMEDVPYFNCWIHPAIHLTMLGMTIGKTNCTTIELGLGTQGILQIGYIYKFNQNNSK